MSLRQALTACVLVALCAAGCERKAPAASNAAPAASAASATAAAAMPGATALGETGRAGRVSFRVGAPLVARPPSNAMRAAEYAIPGGAAGEETSLAVFYFGREGSGSVDENVERWLRQYQSLDNTTVVRDERNVRSMIVGSLRVTLVDISGTLSAAMPGGPGPSAPKPLQRLLGAIVEGPDGMVFFKLTGPIAGVESARRAFEAMLQSLSLDLSAPAPSSPTPAAHGGSAAG